MGKKRDASCWGLLFKLIFKTNISILFISCKRSIFLLYLYPLLTVQEHSLLAGVMITRSRSEVRFEVLTSFWHQYAALVTSLRMTLNLKKNR